MAQRLKRLPPTWETQVQSLGREDPLEEEMGNPLQCFCLGNSMDREAWWATVHSITESDSTEVTLHACVHHEFLKTVFTFPHSSVGKESACSAGDPGSIPGSGRSPGEGNGYPLRYSSVSLVAQLVKSLPAMWETWVRSLGWEDPLEREKAAHSSILAWRIPWTV